MRTQSTKLHRIFAISTTITIFNDNNKHKTKWLLFQQLTFQQIFIYISNFIPHIFHTTIDN